MGSGTGCRTRAKDRHSLRRVQIDGAGKCVEGCSCSPLRMRDEEVEGRIFHPRLNRCTNCCMQYDELMSCVRCSRALSSYIQRDAGHAYMWLNSTLRGRLACIYITARLRSQSTYLQFSSRDMITFLSHITSHQE
jgi:hypothetical protein